MFPSCIFVFCFRSIHWEGLTKNCLKCWQAGGGGGWGAGDSAQRESHICTHTTVYLHYIYYIGACHVRQTTSSIFNCKISGEKYTQLLLSSTPVSTISCGFPSPRGQGWKNRLIYKNYFTVYIAVFFFLCWSGVVLYYFCPSSEYLFVIFKKWNLACNAK